MADIIEKNEIRYFVRVRGVCKGFVEFDFAIGAPDMAVELIMPSALFDVFCRRHRVAVIGRDDGQAIDLERAQWRHGTLDIG